MTAPQWVMIGLILIEAFAHNYRINKNDPDHPGINFFATVIRMVGLISVLYWGGFWK